ncbi:sugar phosphate isomerase/epimerase family protein [Caldicellulosiruptor acetigenus]|uniref:Xylose isomerase domain-containing protein TIM barrel n=1 Tax=Caldicellulosiruptor acetigenus 6A TaxID=632516 RepID=G2PT44_9FIRM|nr:sugar phosphate isomerase/epimerase family protein [Caldicellulosiruptor acetigenus]AEM74203.1 Xylose isomerase domain-containing protein TIM barrel [Caldicellulosiruptor acetigenus 6A]
MKISFSTVGCPNFTWDEILAAAKDFGYDGIELRGLGDELEVYKAEPFSPENLPSTKKRLKELNLEISCLATSCYIFDKSYQENTLESAKAHLELAKNLSCKYIRVLGDRWITPGEDVNREFVKDMLCNLCDMAKEYGVDVLIETNGVWAESKRLADLLEKVPYKNVGVVWDIHHPFRFFNEDVEKTFSNLKEYIKHVHVKDSKIENGKLVFKMIGEGDVPIEKAINLLLRQGYSGYISFEWVKRWFSDLEEPGIVFLEFIDKIKKIVK